MKVSVNSGTFFILQYIVLQMKKFTLVFALLLALASIYGSKGHNGVVIDRPLTWKDFKGKAPKNSAMKAATYYIIEYTVVEQPPNPKFKVTLYFEPKKSWVDKGFLKTADEQASSYLLNHEQVHFNISRIVSWEMEDAMNSFMYDRKKIRYQVDSIYRTYFNKEKAIQRKYDKETNHSGVVDEQEKWNEIVAEGLKNKTINL